MDFSNLPDLCLLAMFKKLNNTDMYAVALTCNRFLKLATEAFGHDFHTYERVDKKILRVFGHNIFSTTIKLRMFEHSPRFSKENLIAGYKQIMEYCPNLKTCQIMLPNAYSDFQHNPNNINWYVSTYELNKNVLDPHDSISLIDITTEAQLNDFINRFIIYLNKEDGGADGNFDFANVDNIYAQLHNTSDLVKSFQIHDLTREDQLRTFAANLTNVHAQVTDYQFDLQRPQHANDQYETVHMIQKYCMNITTFKINIIDVNIFRRSSFKELVRKTTKINISILNDSVDNFENIKVHIQNAMYLCHELKSLTLDVSKSDYLIPFLSVAYQKIRKVRIICSELCDNNLLRDFLCANKSATKLILTTNLIKK